MTAQFPVHPDDIDQLLKIRRYLIGFRKTNKWNQSHLSRLVNGTDGTVWDLESNTTWQWRFSRLQEWPVPFGLRLDARLRFPGNPNLEKHVHSHPEVAPAFTLSQGCSGWQSWQRVYLTSALGIARRQLKVRPHQMAERIGATSSAVWNWEAAGDEILLPKVLHYARALDGFVELKLEELPKP